MTPSNILIVKLSAIGDVVLSTPAIQALRDSHPDACITLLVGEVAAPVVENNPSVDELWRVDEMIFWKKRLIPLIALFRKTRDRHFEEVYILHWSPLFHWFFWLAGIPRRFGFARDGKSFRLTRSVPYAEADGSAHDIHQYLNLVSEQHAVRAQVDDPPKLYFEKVETEAVDRQIKALNCPSDRLWLAIAPGGGNNPKLTMPQKRWPSDHYACLIQMLIEKHRAFVFLVGDSTESRLLDFWWNTLPIESIRNVAGQLSLRQTAILIRQCRFFIGNDSGLLHLSGAVGTPSLAFFGPTSPAGKAPTWLPHEILYTREVCSPCYKHGQAPPCPYNLKCLRNISPEMALVAFEKLMAKTPSPHAAI